MICWVNRKGSGRSLEYADATPYLTAQGGNGQRPASTGATHEYTSQRCRRHSESCDLGSRVHRSDVSQRLSAETANGQAGGLFFPLPSRPTGGLVGTDGRSDACVFAT